MKTRIFEATGIILFLLFCVATIRAQTDNSPDCVRDRPTRISNRKVFPQAVFKLTKTKEYPFEYIGFETLKLKNGDRLTIKNYGCENYSLDFRFETTWFAAKTNRVRYWYQAAAELMDSVLNGLKKDEFLPRVGTEELKKHIKKTKKLRFDDYVYFVDTGIKEGFNLAAVRKSKTGKYLVEISFGVGPL